MKEKSISKISLLFNAILFLTIGMAIVLHHNRYLDFFHRITSLLIILVGAISFLVNIIREKNAKNIALSISTLFIGIFFYHNKTKFLPIFSIVFGLYILLNAFIKWITYMIFKNRENTKLQGVLFASLLDFIIAFYIIIRPLKNIQKLTIVVGLYIMLIGLTYLKDFLKECFPKRKRKGRSLRITPPIIVSVLLPYRVLLKINKLLNKFETPVEIENKNTSGQVDLEILIHVKDSAIGKFGHADLCYQGKIYSYGCYDEESKKLFESIGNGTLFEVEGKEKYIEFCTTHSDKTIFCFGISLTEEEKEIIQKKLKSIKKTTYPWKNIDKNKNEYAYELITNTKAKFYKFKETNYKTYFLFSTNCVKLVDDVVGTLGIDLIKINGVITPGSYYDYLEREFKRQNSHVITKQIYTKQKETPQ